MSITGGFSACFNQAVTYLLVREENYMGQKEITSKRIEWADMARSFAVFCVISCHTVEEVYPFDVSSMMAISFQARILVFGWMILGRLGVPIFLQTATFRGQQGRISRSVRAILNGQPGISAGQRVLCPTDQY